MGCNSCRYGTFSEIGGNIFGLGCHVLYDSTIKNTTDSTMGTIVDNIDVIGYPTGYLMKINNALYNLYLQTDIKYYVTPQPMIFVIYGSTGQMH